MDLSVAFIETLRWVGGGGCHLYKRLEECFILIKLKGG